MSATHPKQLAGEVFLDPNLSVFAIDGAVALSFLSTFDFGTYME